ncbi:tRNA (N(6)-L-threonylcarbamoyladenosine(37)-C(2))-methylthiotransferase MtaB [Sphingorhabdus sp.]|uniref:tRNA (N(6)-L-threonylcarbamoyladenosine(37)-C(2))- methylthiotransferase MtaB n=2 Tax=Sphingorhabdus sp. TaxID=1902408 RepID=UPI003BAE1A92
MNAPEIITLGCRLNLTESEALAQQISDGSDLVIVNSCAVTNEAVRQTRQAIRQARKRRPDARIIVTGCAAQVEPDTFRQMPEIDAVLGNLEKQDAGLFSDRSLDSRVSDIMAVRANAPHLATAFSGHTRAFVEVQTGCDHRCTFCIIPFGRGNARSVPAGKVIAHIQALVDQGVQEVVLTGVDVTSYGCDLPGNDNLGLLVERILKGVHALPRLRLSSIDGIEIDERLFDLITGEARLMPHVHLSLQAGDNLILKRMKRRHAREQAIDLVARMKAARADIAIGADIIAGFPTEDEAMFENSLKLVDECEIVHGHIFPYSPKAGTPAARMPQVAHAAIKARAKALRERVAARRAAWLDTLVETSQTIVVEADGRSGHSENFAYVELDTPTAPGALLKVKVGGVDNGRLKGSIAA